MRSARGVAASRRWPMLVIRAGVSASLLALLLTRVDLVGIATALGGMSGPLFVLACLLFLGGQTINTERWWTLLAMARGSAPRRVFLLRLILAGMFFNFFLPTTVGGDVVRAEMARKKLGGRTDAYLSIVTARLLALVAVLVIGLVASLVAWLRYGWFDRDLALIGLVFLVPAVAIFLLARVRSFGIGKLVGGLPTSWAQLTFSAIESFRSYTTGRRQLAWVFGLSILAQIVGNIFVVWALAASLGILASLSFHLVAVPLITLITLLPVSLNGIGVREGSFVYFYAKVGVAGGEAVALSLGYTLVLVAFSALGGLGLLLPGHEAGRSAATLPSEHQPVSPVDRPASPM